MNFNPAFKTTVNNVPSSNHIDSGYRGMMTNLLCIYGAAFDIPLIGFTKDRIEWFFNIEMKDTIAQEKRCTIFHSFRAIFDFSGFLDEGRCHTECLAGSLEIGIDIEDIDG